MLLSFYNFLQLSTQQHHLIASHLTKKFNYFAVPSWTCWKLFFIFFRSRVKDRSRFYYDLILQVPRLFISIRDVNKKRLHTQIHRLQLAWRWRRRVYATLLFFSSSHWLKLCIYACNALPSPLACTSVFLLTALLFIYFWFAKESLARQFITSIIILHTHGAFLYGKMQVNSCLMLYVQSRLVSVRARHKRRLRGLIFQIATANKQLINWQIKIAVKINHDKKISLTSQ